MLPQLPIGGVEVPSLDREDHVEAAVVGEGDVLAGVASVALPEKKCMRETVGYFSINYWDY